MSKDVNVSDVKVGVNEIKAAVLHVDTLKEIFDLWYELFYMRAIISEIVRDRGNFEKTTFDQARKMAQYWMKEKFPSIDLEY